MSIDPITLLAIIGFSIVEVTVLCAAAWLRWGRR